ncbi:MAG: hypothetical protein KJ043_04480 [Anaerolineae bacterium]|nr:hypothetical protein [Anaerolineae bacterium]
MTDKGQQKPTTRQTARRTKSAPSRRIIQRGLIAQISTALFQPITFFETLAPMRQTRQWLWIGFIILALIGVSAVQQTSSQATPDPETPIAPVGDPFSGGGDFGGELGGNFDFGTPPPIDGTTDTPTDPAQTVNNWTVALIEATRLIIMWGVLSMMLIVVPMFKGKPPQIGENIQVAVYASLPLGVMAALQLIFMAAGGQIGAAGVSGLVNDMPMYQTADPFLRSLILSGASQTTLFMLWSLWMVYFGGRFLLRGHRITVLFVIIAWVALLIIAPVVTGAIQAESADITAPTDEFRPDMGDFSEMPPPSDIEGMMNPFDEMPTDDMMFDITPEAEMTFEPEMMSEIEMTPEAESTLEIEMTPEEVMP